jgi:hypothetical protein
MDERLIKSKLRVAEFFPIKRNWRRNEIKEREILKK